MKNFAKTFVLLTLCVLFVVSSSASAAVIHIDTPSSEYEAYASNFPSVGYLEASLGSDSAFGGSATLIDPYWILTAAHVADKDNFTWKFGIGSNSIDGSGVEYEVAEVFLHPDFTTIGVSPDIALMRLVNPVTNVTPSTLFTGTLQIEELVSIVGYGAWGTPNGFNPYDGNKRAIINEIVSFGNSFFGVPEDHVMTEFIPPGFSDAQRLGGTGSNGDSGGGWFADINGEMQLVGVSGFQIGQPAYLSITGGLRTSLYNDWIVTTMVPEPSSILLLVLGMGGFLFQHRRLAA